MICPHCGKEHPDAAAFCPETGRTISGRAVCPHCGQVHPAGAQFCPVTGNQISAASELQTAAPGKKSRRLFTLALPILLVFCLAAGAAGVFAAGNLPLKGIPFLPVAASSTPLAKQTSPPADSKDPDRPTQTPLLSPTDTPTLLSTSTKRPTITPSPTLDPKNPIGKIVYTCQIFKDGSRNQICIVNADGTNQRRLTADDYSDHYYASLSPDGLSIVFSSNQGGTYEIYEMDLQGNQRKLTALGKVYAPEISPDGQSIAFTNGTGLFQSIWVMDRNGQNPHPVFEREGVNAVDPTWSPDGRKILFAMGSEVETKQLFTMNRDGTDVQPVSSDFITRGRSDWSWRGERIAGYSGASGKRKIYLMNADGSNLVELYSTGNVQAPSFSPDDNWVVFTGYIDNSGSNGCEIYILRTNGEYLNRLTNNDFCDWQPRWGP